MTAKRTEIRNPKDLQFLESYDHYTLDNPHAGDPRCLQANTFAYCKLRYTLYCRCCRELGEDDPRCKHMFNGHTTESSTSQYASLAATMVKKLNNRKKFKLSKFESCDWHIPTETVQCELLDLFKCVVDNSTSWEDLKKHLIFGVNDINEAIENDTKISAIILFKGNTVTSLIQHFPYACELKNIKFVTILKRLDLGSDMPTEFISCVAIRENPTNDRIVALTNSISRHF